MTWEPELYRDIWANDLRLVIDKQDVTYFRNALAQIGGYQLQEPFAYGPAEFAFPQVTQLEVDTFGKKGKLSWLREGAPVELRPVVDGHYGERVWAGFITQIATSTAGTQINCDGELSGRLALLDRHPPVFTFTKDIGLIMYDTVLAGRVSMRPYLGPKTGIRRANIGGGVSQLDHALELLSTSLTSFGNQWTVARDGRQYRMRLKDQTTVHATVFLGAEGVTLDVARAIQEEPTSIYGTGTQPDGTKIMNAIAPNLFSSKPATYPFNDNRTFGLGTTDAMTDTGAGMYAMHRKLVGHGFMTRREGANNVYDAGTVAAVRALQRRAGLPRTGTMNPRTWRALFNVTKTGRHLYGAGVLPMAQLDAVTRFTRTSNGSIDRLNPGYDPKRVKVDMTVDHGGGVWKRDMLTWSDRLLDRIHAEKNWAGTLALTGADLFAGNVGPTTSNPTAISRLDIREGWNIKVVGYDGDTVFHVAGVNVDGDRNVRMAVDTRFRDLLTLGQIIARNAESRRHPAREFVRSVRRPNAMSTMVTSNELFGILGQDTPLQGGRWNKVPVVAGQSGTVERVRIRLRDNRAEFVMAVLDRNMRTKRMGRVGGREPLSAGSKWAKEHVQERLKTEFLALYTAGQARQPLGYHPRAHRGDNDKVTGAPITGNWSDDAGFDFYTLGGGVLWLFIFPDRDCTLKAGKLLYLNHAEGA